MRILSRRSSTDRKVEGGLWNGPFRPIAPLEFHFSTGAEVIGETFAKDSGHLLTYTQRGLLAAVLIIIGFSSGHCSWWAVDCLVGLQRHSR